MAPSTRIPVVSCGRDAKVAAVIRQGLLPEYDLIHVCESVDLAKQDLPSLLLGHPPPSLSSQTNTTTTTPNPGSGNFARLPPFAILAGGAYTDADIAEIRQGIVEKAGEEADRRTPWVRPDMGKEWPAPGPELARTMVDGVRGVLGGLVRGEVGGDGGVFEF